MEIPGFLKPVLFAVTQTDIENIEKEINKMTNNKLDYHGRDHAASGIYMGRLEKLIPEQEEGAVKCILDRRGKIWDMKRGEYI